MADQDDQQQPEETVDIYPALLQEELKAAQAEAQDYKNKYLRALADYQNFEKRVREEREELIKSTQSRLILRIIAFLDNLEQAEVFVKDKGLKMVKDQFYKTLSELGLEEIDVLNQEFDPHTAEAIDIVEGEKDNINVEVLRKGYQMHGRVIRPAHVKVSKKISQNGSAN